MNTLNPCFKTIVDYVVNNKASMPPEVKKAIASKARNIIIRLDEPIEAPKKELSQRSDELVDDPKKEPSQTGDELVDESKKEPSQTGNATVAGNNQGNAQ